MILIGAKLKKKWFGSPFLSRPSLGFLLFRNYGSTTDDIFFSPETYARSRISQNMLYLWREKKTKINCYCLFPKTRSYHEREG
jgi:hypothetical protein